MTKARYDLLDGLRGVAAVMVTLYHIYECFPMDTWIVGHGYLAVDFFFILSGFVIGYAYDDRWAGEQRSRLTIWQFFKRRLVRLHPMVLFGVMWGLVCFLLAGGTGWDGTKATTSALMIATVTGLLLIPQHPGAEGDVRGNQEMFSLNGPHWSLFFEYIGNAMYALFLRHLTTKALAAWTAVLGILFAWFFVADYVGYGNIGVGWTLEGMNFRGGLLRMSFSFSAGLLLSRLFETRSGKKPYIRNAFWICSLLIITFLSVPQFSEGNCIYETACVMFLFPLVVWMAASGKVAGRRSVAICSFLGEISYPLYAVHYPTMYLFYAYIGFPDTWRTPGECWPWMTALFAGNVVFAYIALKLYDLPVRKWLAGKLR